MANFIKSSVDGSPLGSFPRGIRFGAIGVILLALALLSTCTMTRVAPDAGVEAVLVSKPLIFGHGGVQESPVKTGSTWVVFTTEPVYVNVQPQQYDIAINDLMASDGVPLHFDAAIRLQVTDSVELIRKFGPRWYENNIQTEFTSRTRQAVRKHSMNELAIQASGVDAVDVEVTTGLESYIRQIGMPVKLVKVTVGKATPPEEIKQQRIKTAEQQQRQQTEAQTKLAEDAREAAERSRAVADNAYRQTLNLTPQEFVELQRIDMQKAVCAREGSQCTFIVGNGTPVVNSGRK